MIVEDNRGWLLSNKSKRLVTRHGVEYYFYYVVTLWYFNLSFYVEGIKRKNCFYLIVYTPIYLVCSETDTLDPIYYGIILLKFL